jgi:hypothetical protein
MKNIFQINSEIFQDLLNMQFDKIATDTTDFLTETAGKTIWDQAKEGKYHSLEKKEKQPNLSN